MLGEREGAAVVADNDDWTDVVPVGSQKHADHEASLRVAKGPRGLLTVWVTFKGAARAALEPLGDQYRVQVGGPGGHKVRFTPDVRPGHFALADRKIWKGSRVCFPLPGGWAPEVRESEPARWEILDGAMLLTLRADWATPNAPAPERARAAPPPAPRSPALAPIPPRAPLQIRPPGVQYVPRAGFELEKIGRAKLTSTERLFLACLLHAGAVPRAGVADLMGCGERAVHSIVDGLTEKMRGQGYKLLDDTDRWTLGPTALADLRLIASRAV